MKAGWRTRAIGRHLVDLQGDARTIESYRFNKVPIELLPAIRTGQHFNDLVARREQELRAMRKKSGGSLFIERVTHANGSVTLVSWLDLGVEYYHFDSYIRAGSRALQYSGDVSPSRKISALSACDELAREWREVAPGEMPTGLGYVADDTILMDRDMNRESWEMVIQLAGKPDVSFKISAYAQYQVEPGLRQRAGGILAGLLGAVAGVSQLRNRERPVGPIQGDEILVAGTQDGKRTYGFKWEAPGKANSLAEPNLNASLQVGESAYLTNKESFASDDEALELWDAVVGSLRLRPGAV
ncbi:T6SS immunity protein Tli4 family protein [Cupriavidus sp. WKF15]|uniref:T6SS immunity protein Tli4 family protein n=1 Tax=Cupriavidus sp. WKF15 TaxID=3032282 RepID=UPI0023E20FEE|nr:T6SS immunity protein Tli4 family protein [Cupriavidus sp. WKF15]WER48140.1 T6SS immunity protein Tli4 family protein [Cupriavidus sp. WKF15]